MGSAMENDQNPVEFSARDIPASHAFGVRVLDVIRDFLAAKQSEAPRPSCSSTYTTTPPHSTSAPVDLEASILSKISELPERWLIGSSPVVGVIAPAPSLGVHLFPHPSVNTVPLARDQSIDELSSVLSVHGHTDVSEFSTPAFPTDGLQVHSLHHIGEQSHVGTAPVGLSAFDHLKVVASGLSVTSSQCAAANRGAHQQQPSTHPMPQESLATAVPQSSPNVTGQKLNHPDATAVSSVTSATHAVDVALLDSVANRGVLSSGGLLNTTSSTIHDTAIASSSLSVNAGVHQQEAPAECDDASVAAPVDMAVLHAPADKCVSVAFEGATRQPLSSEVAPTPALANTTASIVEGETISLSNVGSETGLKGLSTATGGQDAPDAGLSPEATATRSQTSASTSPPTPAQPLNDENQVSPSSPSFDHLSLIALDGHSAEASPNPPGAYAAKGHFGVSRSSPIAPLHASPLASDSPQSHLSAGTVVKASGIPSAVEPTIVYGQAGQGPAEILKKWPSVAASVRNINDHTPAYHQSCSTEPLHSALNQTSKSSSDWMSFHHSPTLSESNPASVLSDSLQHHHPTSLHH